LVGLDHRNTPPLRPASATGHVPTQPAITDVATRSVLVFGFSLESSGEYHQNTGYVIYTYVEEAAESAKRVYQELGGTEKAQRRQRIFDDLTDVLQNSMMKLRKL
jgi:hypothetical protein